MTQMFCVSQSGQTNTGEGDAKETCGKNEPVSESQFAKLEKINEAVS